MNCSVQDAYYSRYMHNRVNVYLQTGIRLTGKITRVGSACLVLETRNSNMLIRKQSISSVQPQQLQ
jgi:RNA chaperone Hfq